MPPMPGGQVGIVAPPIAEAKPLALVLIVVKTTAEMIRLAAKASVSASPGRRLWLLPNRHGKRAAKNDLHRRGERPRGLNP